MATEKLEIQIGADIVEVTKSIDQLERELQGLGKSLKSAVPGSQAFNDLSKAFTRQQVIIAGVNKEIAKTTPTLGKLGNATGQTTQTLINFSRVAQDAPFGIIGIANNIDPLIQSFSALRKETGSVGGALKALAGGLIGGGGLAVAVSAVTSAFTFFALSQRGANKELKESKSETDSYVQNLTKQKEELNALVSIVKNETLAEDDRNRALQKLNDIIPDSIGFLNRQNIATAEGVNILRQYVKAIEARATAELLINRIAENNIKLFDNRNKVLAGNAKFEQDILNLRQKAESLRSRNQFEAAATIEAQIFNIQKQSAGALGEIRKEQQGILDDNQRLREQYEKILPAVIELDKVGKGISDKTKKTTEAVVEQLRVYQELNKVQAEIQSRSLDPTIINAPRQTNPINIQRADRTSSLVITPEALRLQGQYSLQLDEVLEKLRLQQELVKSISDTITGGLNAGIDQFFNAIANNQDPFEALAQSVKRLVAELAAAVVKALILKAVTAALSGGTSAGLEGLVGGGGGGGILQSLLRGPDIGLSLIRQTRP